MLRYVVNKNVMIMEDIVSRIKAFKRNRGAGTCFTEKLSQ